MAKEDINLGLDFSTMTDVGTSFGNNIQTEEETNEEIKKVENGETSGLEIQADDSNKIPFDFAELFKQENTETSDTKKKDEELVKSKAESTSSKSTKNSSSNVPFSILSFKSLQEEDAISGFDEETFTKEVEELGEAQAIINVYRKEADIIREVLKQDLAEDIKEYTNLLDLGVARDEANKLMASKLEFSKITDEEIDKEGNEELCKSLIVKNLKNTTKLTDAQIKKQVDRAANSGELTEDAKEALKGIMDYDKSQVEAAKQKAIQEKQAEETSRKEAVEKYKAVVEATDEIIPGQKINKQTKAKVTEAIFSGLAWEVRKKDPYKFDAVMNYLVLSGVFEGKTDKLGAKAKTSAIQELQNVLNTSKKTDLKVNMFNEDPEEVENDRVTNFLSNKRKN
jgi:hypothetical protein